VSASLSGGSTVEKQAFNPKGVFKHPNFTRVVSLTGPMTIILIAGQTPGDETDNHCVAPGDWRAQYLKVMSNLELQLKAAGASWDDVVYKREFVLDMDEYLKVINDPATPKFGNPQRQPPGTLVGVTRLTNPEFLIEIDLVAVVPAAG
jgi:enamine deaminase RidA (YjgF/YER057c/UK114 family)